MAPTGKSSDAVELVVGDRTVRLTHPDRVYFPKTGATKLDLAQYYMAVGDGIVRALRERPCMLHRFPDGLDGDKVHQKCLPRGAPDWVQTVSFWAETSKREVSYALCNDRRTLLWFANQRAIEYHTALVRAARPDRMPGKRTCAGRPRRSIGDATCRSRRASASDRPRKNRNAAAARNA